MSTDSYTNQSKNFFAAAFITRLDQDKKCKFYGRCRTDSEFHATFSNTLFFLDEIDNYNYLEFLFVPAVSMLLDLDGAEITDGTRPGPRVIERLCATVGVRAKHVEIFNSALNKRGVEEELYTPAIISQSSVSVSESELFTFASERLISSSRRERTLKYIVNNGEALDKNIRRSTFG